jgi:hypothetical protein
VKSAVDMTLNRVMWFILTDMGNDAIVQIMMRERKSRYQFSHSTILIVYLHQSTLLKKRLKRCGRIFSHPVKNVHLMEHTSAQVANVVSRDMTILFIRRGK